MFCSIEKFKANRGEGKTSSMTPRVLYLFGIQFERSVSDDEGNRRHGWNAVAVDSYLSYQIWQALAQLERE